MRRTLFGVVLFPIYWLCVVVANLAWVFVAIAGAIVGMLVYWIFFPLPPASGFQAILLLAATIGLGIFTANRLGPALRRGLAMVIEWISGELGY
jgi:hypothetical protein